MFNEDKEKAIELRKQGKSLDQILETVNHARSTVFLWIKDVPVSDEQKQIWLHTTKHPQAEKKKEYLDSINYKREKTILDENYNPKDIGEKSCAQIMAQLIAAGKNVLMPFGDNKRYDLVVEEDGKFYRIQCKTAQYYGTTIVFKTRSTNWNSGKQRDYRGQIELFAVYYRQENKVYLINVNNCPINCCTLRFVEPFNKNKQNIRMAKDYEFIPDKKMNEYL